MTNPCGNLKASAEMLAEAEMLIQCSGTVINPVFLTLIMFSFWNTVTDLRWFASRTCSESVKKELQEIFFGWKWKISQFFSLSLSCNRYKMSVTLRGINIKHKQLGEVVGIYMKNGLINYSLGTSHRINYILESKSWTMSTSLMPGLQMQLKWMVNFSVDVCVYINYWIYVVCVAWRSLYTLISLCNWVL